MSQHVCQRLLQDPVGGVIDAGRQRQPLAGDHQADRSTCCSDRVGQRIKPVQASGPGLGAIDVTGIAAQRAERHPHVRQRGLAGFPDRCQRVADLWVGRAGTAGPVQRGTGLHGYRRHRMGHRVMQFTGDPQPLLGDSAASLGLAFLVSQPEPVGRFGGKRPPAAHVVAQHDGQRKQHERRQEVRHERGQLLVGRRTHEYQSDRHVDGGYHDRPGQVACHGGVVEREREQRDWRDVTAVRAVEDQEQHGARDQDLERPSPAQQDRNRDHDAQRIGAAIQRSLARSGRYDHVKLHSGGHASRDPDVDRPDPEPAVQLCHVVKLRGRPGGWNGEIRTGMPVQRSCERHSPADPWPGRRRWTAHSAGRNAEFPRCRRVSDRGRRHHRVASAAALRRAAPPRRRRRGRARQARLAHRARSADIRGSSDRAEPARRPDPAWGRDHAHLAGRRGPDRAACRPRRHLPVHRRSAGRGHRGGRAVPGQARRAAGAGALLGRQGQDGHRGGLRARRGRRP